MTRLVIVGGMVFEETSAEAAFAGSLKDARIARGLTQAEVAEEMSKRGFRWHPPTVYKIEKGERQIQLGEAVALAGILGYSLDAMTKSPEVAAARRRKDLRILLLDAADAAGGIAVERSKYVQAVRKLRTALEETPELEELFTGEELELMRWYADSDFSKGVEDLKFDAPIFQTSKEPLF